MDGKKKQSYLINIYGGPGVGKSTLSDGLAYFLKIDSSFGDVENVPEEAKRLVWRGEFETLKNQPLVTKGQIDNIMGVAGKMDIIICDSPIDQGYVYLSNPNHSQEVHKLITNAEKKLRELGVNTINILIEHHDNGFSPKADVAFQKEGRIHDEEQSRDLGTRIKELLDNRGVDYTTIKAHTDIATVLLKVGELMGKSKGLSIDPIVLPDKKTKINIDTSIKPS